MLVTVTRHVFKDTAEKMSSGGAGGGEGERLGKHRGTRRLIGGEMRQGLTAGGGMVLGMMVGIVFDHLGRGDDHRGMVLGLVFGLVFGGAAARRRSRVANGQGGSKD